MKVKNKVFLGSAIALPLAITPVICLTGCNNSTIKEYEFKYTEKYGHGSYMPDECLPEAEGSDPKEINLKKGKYCFNIKSIQSGSNPSSFRIDINSTDRSFINKTSWKVYYNNTDVTNDWEYNDSNPDISARTGSYTEGSLKLEVEITKTINCAIYCLTI